MVLWHLDEHDPDTVGIGERHFGQAPRLAPGRAHDLRAERLKPLMLGAHIAHLQPQRHRPGAVMPSSAGDFEETTAQEEDNAAVRGAAELAIHGESEHVTIEALCAVQIGGPKQNAAGKYVHQAMMTPWSARARDRSSPVIPPKTAHDGG